MELVEGCEFFVQDARRGGCGHGFGGGIHADWELCESLEFLHDGNFPRVLERDFCFSPFAAVLN